MTKTIIIPAQLKECRFIKVDAEKRPIELNWQNTKNYAYDDKNFNQWVEQNMRYGVCTGFNNLVVLDFDQQAIQDTVLPQLPETFTVRTARKRLYHLYYFVDTPENMKILDDQKVTLCDVQGRGKQVIGAGSRIPDGRTYDIIKDIPIAHISMADIKKVLEPYNHTGERKGGYNPDEWVRDHRAQSIKRALSVSALLQEEGINTKKNPTDCPFHDSKGGKCLHYDDVKGLWNCFHCNTGGDVITLYSKIHSIAPFEAIKVLAERVGVTQEDTRHYIELPAGGNSFTERTIGRFACDVGKVLGKERAIFYKPDINMVVEVRMLKVESGEECLGFAEVSPTRLVTLLERYALLYRIVKTKDGDEMQLEKNLSVTHAGIVLESDQLRTELPIIRRVFSIPIPIIYHGELTFPAKGYDERFCSWLDPTSPDIQDVDVEHAKMCLDLIFKEYCFKDPVQDKVHALAGFITPFLRGLYTSWNERTPLFFYLANRERAGKDYCAGMTGVLYEGIAAEEPPISDGSKNDAGKSEELRKKIMSALIAGRKRLHFSNCKGRIDNSMLENIITNKHFRDRLLGKNTMVSLDNEMDFSLSGNLGITYTADLENRSRFINLLLAEEDPNSRHFRNADLHGWILNNRGYILGSLFALVKEWYAKGKPDCSSPFTSFPSWARICGGVMEANGLGNPCLPQVGFSIAGNQTDRDMKVLFELAHDHFGSQEFTKGELISKLAEWQDEVEIFTNFDKFTSDKQNERTGERAKFSKLFERYVGRIFGKVQLIRITPEGFQKQRYILKALQ